MTLVLAALAVFVVGGQSRPNAEPGFGQRQPVVIVSGAKDFGGSIGPTTVATILVSFVVQPDLPALDATLDALVASTFEARQEGVEQLETLVESDASLLASATVEDRMAALLEIEFTAFKTAGPSYSGRQRSFFIDHLSQLAFRWLERTPPLSERFLSAAVRIPHNPFTGFTRLVAQHGDPATQSALELANADRAIVRSQGYSLIGELLHANDAADVRVAITNAHRTALLERLRAGLLDQEAFCRRDAIRSAVLARDHAALPLLTHLMNTDADDGAGRPAAYQSVRKLAAAAVQTLSQ